ncbi:hypothetical protein BJ546DRAFT_1063538 [Cryomyces antarcticus]
MTAREGSKPFRSEDRGKRAFQLFEAEQVRLDGPLPSSTSARSYHSRNVASQHRPPTRSGNFAFEDPAPIRREDYIRRQRSPVQYAVRSPTRPALLLSEREVRHDDYDQPYEYENAHQLHVPRDTPYEDYRTVERGPDDVVLRASRASQNRQPARPYSRTERQQPYDYSVGGYSSNPRVSSRPDRNTFAAPTTPSPQKMSQLRISQLDSVTSPFFRSGGPPRQAIPTSQQPERRPADRRGEVEALAQSYRFAPARHGWDEPRSLNGLSFISDPHASASHEPLYRARPPTTTTGYKPRFLVQPTPRNAQGLYQRPDGPEPLHRQTRAPLPPQSRANTYSRQSRHALPLPSTNPSLSSSFRPPLSARAFTRDDALATVKGARSGPARATLLGRGYGGGAALQESVHRGGEYGGGGGAGSLFEMGGRRSVRR